MRNLKQNPLEKDFPFDKIRAGDAEAAFQKAESVLATLGIYKESEGQTRADRYILPNGNLLSVSFQELRGSGCGHLFVLLMSKYVSPIPSHTVFGESAAQIEDIEDCIRRAVAAKDNKK